MRKRKSPVKNKEHELVTLFNIFMAFFSSVFASITDMKDVISQKKPDIVPESKQFRPKSYVNKRRAIK